ncbi:MAG TPA: hypothetical protein VMW42_04190 [Desulfatiglandales bacterium]|nr:hypothetical protein [Desulfatiglandales bacterium]
MPEEFNWGLNWQSLFRVGGLAGLAAFLWLLIKDIFNFFRRPRLKIIFRGEMDLRTWTYRDSGKQRKTATLNIKNKRNVTARRCVAVLKILEKPNGAEHLEEEYPLHWAGTDANSASSTGSDPVDIGLEMRRLDVAFTQRGQDLDGSWIAVPLSLSGSLERNQAYLPPGVYKVLIKVACENGKGAKGKFKIISPSDWNSLSFLKTKIFSHD